MLLLVLVSATSVIDVALSRAAHPHSRADFLSVFRRSSSTPLLWSSSAPKRQLRANEALWGLWLVPFGILVIKSGLIPKVIGVFLLIASVGYMAMSVVNIAFPAYAASVDRVAGLLIQGELTVILWLLIKGARRDTTSPMAGALAGEHVSRVGS